jgi:hypothetical protein
MTHDGGDTWYYEFGGTFQPGQYNFTIFANDTYGNWNYTSGYDFIVNDIIAPNITNIIAPSTTPNSNVIITANVTDAYWNSIDTVLANVTWDSTSELLVMVYNPATGLYNATFTNTTLEGTYNITIIANDTYGNTANATSQFTISKITPPATPGGGGAPPIATTRCGDGLCSDMEDCDSCPEDCGTCHVVIPENVTIDVELFEKVDGLNIPIQNLTSVILNEKQLVLVLKNTGDTVFENLSFRLLYPKDELVPDEIHYGTPVGWGLENLIGWKLLGPVRDSDLTKWADQEIYITDRLDPQSEVEVLLDMLPPITKIRIAELIFQVLSYNTVIAEEKANLGIIVPPSIVTAEYNKESDTVDLFILVNNLNSSKRIDSVYIEFNLNDGKTTKIFELFGPYKIDANDIMVIADKYKLADNIGGKTYNMTIKVYSSINMISRTADILDLGERQPKENPSLLSGLTNSFK